MTHDSKCIFCSDIVDIEHANTYEIDKISCKNCGKYAYCSQFYLYLKKNEYGFSNPQEKTNISYNIHKLNKQCYLPVFVKDEKESIGEKYFDDVIVYKNLDKLKNIGLSFIQKSNLWLDYLCEKAFQNTSPYKYSVNYFITLRECRQNCTIDDGDAFYIFQYLQNKGYLKFNGVQGAQGDWQISDPFIKLTPIGIIDYENRQMNKNKNSKKVFIAMPFIEKRIDGLQRFNVQNAIQIACREFGFEANTVDEIKHNELITDRIISEIKKSDFLIADFTGNNNGVYYEAGFAKGQNIPVIHIAQNSCFKNENLKLHFDINSTCFIIFEDENDLVIKLTDHIHATILSNIK